MRDLFKISILLLIYILFSAKSCSDSELKESRHEELVMATRDSIINKLDTEFLSEETFFLAQKSAEQKLLDLADFLNIYYQSNLDTTFKKQTARMILDIFINEDAEVMLGKNTRNNKVLTVKQLLESDFGSDCIKSTFHFDSLSLSETLTRRNGKTYFGALNFKQSFIAYKSMDTLIIEPFNSTADFYLTKVQKYFGAEMLEIWEVKIGNIKSVRN
ncbi:MAG: hypothetical protein COW63_19510 [Bacteroidetes bacterium CG18_big_fil_WC_8_21_14_2_50_41_14]|nr:MAG: hypothetical protein COW63_19510 [Bacteroidetes bacterium CG18_big_fil_WC_8_21_14_2_50_41_14]PJB56548.1 MAG: hypothetical protein CO098_13605 [Bacteroidetes bacterium CG_4_9_14_3_um_filter_41_19]